MPKYNLMESQQPEFFDDNFEPKDTKSDKPEPERKITEPTQKKPVTPDSDSDFSEKIFSEPAISKIRDQQPEPDSVPASQPQEVAPLSKSETPATESAVKPVPTRPTPPPETSIEEISSYEFTQPKPNLKPFLIGIGIVAVVAVIFLIVWKLFLSAKEEIVAPVETPEAKLRREIQARKDNFITTLNSDTHNRLGYIMQLINLKPAKVRYSGIYLYGQNFSIETFTANRSDLADFNMKLKNTPTLANLKLETVDKRPGTKGGFFALYDFKTPGANGAPTSVTSSGTERIIKTPQEWLTEFSQKNGLNVDTQRQVASRQEELFSVSRFEYKLKGSEQNCQALIAMLASANTNIGIHKLTLLPTNQRDMAKSPYQLQLILDFYL